MHHKPPPVHSSAMCATWLAWRPPQNPKAFAVGQNGAHGPNPKAKQHRGTQRVHSDRLVSACTAMWSALFAHLCNGHVHIVAPTFGWGPTHAAMHTQWVRNGGSCCAWPKECTPCGAWRPCHPEGDHSLAGAAHHHPATWASCSCAPQWGEKVEKCEKCAKCASGHRCGWSHLHVHGGPMHALVERIRWRLVGSSCPTFGP